jgi:RNA polymerase sigma-70 factor (ECF subfamily)
MTVPLFLLRDSGEDSADAFKFGDTERGDSLRASSRRAALTLAPDLLHRLRARDETAYAELLRIAFPVLVRFAYSIVHVRDTAQDVVQGVVCKVWEQGETFSPHGSIEAYLYAAVRNESLKIGRSRDMRLRHEANVRDAIVSNNTSSPDEVIVMDELTEAYHRALRDLTERQRTAFVLRYTDERTVSDVAHILGVTVRATERLLARATEELRAALRPLKP